MPGDTLAYTIVVSNAGPSAATNVVLNDPLPAGLTLVSVTGDCTALPCTFGLLPLGTTRTITMNALVPVSYTATTIINTAGITIQSPDPVPGNNSSTVTTTLDFNADVGLTKSVTPGAATSGDQVTFTLTVQNAGPAPATGVVVADLLPAGFRLDSPTASQGSYALATGLWTIGSLANGQTETLTLIGTVTQPGIISNLATIAKADQPDPDPSNNSAMAAINDAAAGDLAVSKQVDNPTPTVGQNVIFTVTLSSASGPSATGVEVSDALPAGLTLVLATPSQGAYAGGVWQVGTLAPGDPAQLVIEATVNAPG